MPRADFTEDLNIPGSSGRSEFVQLKSKGEKIKFRIAGTPFYRGQHWPSNNGQPVDCPQVNQDEHCEYCDKFEAGELPADVKVDSKGKVVKGRNWYKPTVQFLYPVLNRETEESQIFQTTLSVHMSIREAAKAGVDVYKSDWQVTRNEGSPANYYSVVRLDATKLSKTEEEALAAAKEIDFDAIYKSEAKASSMSPEESKPEVKSDSSDDLPFD